MKLTILHNPRCSKSRQTLALLTERGLQPEVVRYLDQPPDVPMLKRIIELLGIPAHELLRAGEAEYKKLGLSEATPADQLIAAMIEHPGLIERPIVIHGEQARIGRPPERVLEILT